LDHVFIVCFWVKKEVENILKRKNYNFFESVDPTLGNEGSITLILVENTSLFCDSRSMKVDAPRNHVTHKSCTAQEDRQNNDERQGRSTTVASGAAHVFEPKSG
jgi:hypothetical protein